MWKLVQRVVIHPRDSQEEAPFAELRYPVLRTSEKMSEAAMLQLGML
jgi:hypothetical protein